jgi:hypothetical protein
MTNEELRKMFVYESRGMLRRVGGRKDYPWRRIGTKKVYLATTVRGETFYLHRLVWQYHRGTVPSVIDHIDNDPTNNRIENLRECTNAENQYNSAIKRNNKAGHKGVVFHPKCVAKPWQAKIVAAGKVHSLGYFATPEQAGAAYAKAAPHFAGAFARTR